MSNVTISGSAAGNALQSLLMADDVQPGDEPSYQLCKIIYLYHPMGAKMVESPITIAMSQRREISIPKSPETLVKDAYWKEWAKLGCDNLIANVMHIKRIYGVAAVAYGAEGVPTEHAIPPDEIANLNLYFNVFDPLNTAGSLVLNQNPNSPDFQKVNQISVGGKSYNRSRTCVVLNESPVYIAYTSSAFGYVGRSVFQRALFPLKSYVQSMITNDMVITKAGVLIAKTKRPGSITDNLTSMFQKQKRDMVKEASQGNVISVDIDEQIETLNLNNTDTAIKTARTNIIEDIASSANMPPKLLLADSYASVLANGTEDFKATMQYIDALRKEMQPLYDFFDRIVQQRAWNREFYATIQAQFPEEYGSVGYTQAFYTWKNDFSAVWPSLQEEPESDKADAEKVKLDAIQGVVEKLSPHLDPENLATLIEWAADNINENKIMFTNPLNLDIEALKAYTSPDPMGGMDGMGGPGEEEGKPDQPQPGA
jgi:hypothetical protein